MNTFMILAKYIIVHKIAKFKYFAKQIVNWKSPGQMLQSDIYNTFIFQEFEIFSDNLKWRKFRPFCSNHP